MRIHLNGGSLHAVIAEVLEDHRVTVTTMRDGRAQFICSCDTVGLAPNTEAAQLRAEQHQADYIVDRLQSLKRKDAA